MKTRLLAAMAVSTAALAPMAIQSAPAHAVESAQVWAGWDTKGTAVTTDDAINFRSPSRTITSADVGKTIELRVNVDTQVASINVPDAKLQYLSNTGKWTEPKIDWTLSGGWAGGSNLTTKVTSDMVGQTLGLVGTITPKAGVNKFVVTGQQTIGSEVARSTSTVTRPATTTTQPTNPTTTTTTPPTTTTPATGGAINLSALPRVPWEGGADYYKQFPGAVKAGWANPNHFPIIYWWGGVGSDADVKYDKSMGINTYAMLNAATDVKLLENNGMSYANKTEPNGSLQVPASSKVRAIDLLDDEIDGWSKDEDILPTMQERVNRLSNHDFPRWHNFTGRVYSWLGNTQWKELTGKAVNNYTDMASSDAYWYSGELCDREDQQGWGWMLPFGDPDNHQLDRQACRSAQNYGRNTERLRIRDAEDGKLQPIMSYVESVPTGTDIQNMVYAVTPEDVKGAAMSSLIHEARGLLWFGQSFRGNDPKTGKDYNTGNSLRAAQNNPNYPGKPHVEAMGEVNRLAQKLAPVLNSQSYKWDFDGPTKNSVETMLKQYNGSAYVFAMPSDLGNGWGAGQKTFTLPAGMQGTNRTIEVVGENRTIKVSADGKSFTDNFAGLNSYHVYKIS